jgi:PPE-repeat protein
MDFGSLPPELNSALMYTGPGSAPMVAAASAWNGLAAELNAAALAYEAQITQLTSEEWLGPASAAMAEAFTPYVSWMGQTSAQAEQAAGQATAAAAAYDTAFASIVPPPLVDANRALLAQALMTNVFGQNGNVIAQLEAQYAEMWAQDSAVMYQYAASSANAAAVTPFAAPPQVANPSASATQAAAVAQAAATPAESVADTLTNLINQINAQLTALANPALDPMFAQWFNLLGLPTLSSTTANFETFPANSILGSIANGLGGSNIVNPAWFVGVFRNFAGPAYNIEGLPYFSTGMANTLLALSKGLAPAAAAAGGAANGLAGLGGMLGNGGSGVAAALGEASSVGKLSVPGAFAGLAPPVTHAAPLPVTAISAAPEGGGAGNLLGGLPLAGIGSAAAGAGPKYGFRPTVMARPPFAG